MRYEREELNHDSPQFLVSKFSFWGLSFVLGVAACQSAPEAEDGKPSDHQMSSADDEESDPDESESESTSTDPSEDSSESDTSEDSSDEESSTDSSESPDETESEDSENESSSEDTSEDEELTPDDSMPDVVPEVTGVCPAFEDGDAVFRPSGLDTERKVRIWVSDAANKSDGPLVFYWHGTGSSPNEARVGLGSTIEKITAMGGMVVAPYHDPAAGQFPWFLVSGQREDDLILADEVLACAIQERGVDLRRVHTAGMSAGGLQSSQMSFRRSNYLASAVIYSGGFIGAAPENQNPDNHLSAMIFHGGASDIVVVEFEKTSNAYLDALQDGGHFGFICDHGNGHSIPKEVGESVLQFFLDHPYNVQPKPYEDGLPEGFPVYCTLP